MFLKCLVPLLLLPLTIVLCGCDNQSTINVELPTLFEEFKKDYRGTYEKYKGKWVRFKGRVKSNHPEKGINLYLGVKSHPIDDYFFLIQPPANPASRIIDKYKIGKAYTFKVKILGSNSYYRGGIFYWGIIATFEGDNSK